MIGRPTDWLRLAAESGVRRLQVRAGFWLLRVVVRTFFIVLILLTLLIAHLWTKL